LCLRLEAYLLRYLQCEKNPNERPTGWVQAVVARFATACAEVLEPRENEMGIFDFIKGQLIEVIEWQDRTRDTLVYRFPVRDNEIKMGAQLIVREGQAAVFVNEGELADVFEPGRHTLSTQNMPVLTKLKSWKYGFNSPFKAEVYFVNTRVFTDLKWGTSNPIMMRDPEFGVVRLRAFGIYSMRVADPEKFLRDVVGTDGYFTTEEITGQLKRMIVSTFSDMVGRSDIPVLDLAGNYDKISSMLKEKVQTDFQDHGLALVKLFIENISLPPEVEKAIDKRTSMGVVGAGNYMQYQMAESLGKGQGGGMAGTAAELAAGLAMGQQMTQAFSQPSAPATDFRKPPAAPRPSGASPDAEQRFFVLARTALKNTQGKLSPAISSMLENNRKRANISEERAAELIDKARAELGLSTAAMEEYKEIMAVFLADGHLSDDERAILIERQVELGLTDEQVAQIERELKGG